MTKETKIGLLAGLAFIIVIGIVLSDHLTSSTEPPPAALGGTGNNVRATVGTPAQPQSPIAIVVPPSQVSPAQQVPTPSDLENQATASHVIKVGPPSIALQSNPTVVQSTTPQAPQPQPATGSRSTAERPVATTETPKTPLERVASQMGEQIVPVGSTQTPTVTASASGMTDYTVQSGDTLSQIAQRIMGSSKPANIEAILAANPSLGGNPNKIIVGKTYKIPGTGAVVSAPSAPAPAISAPAQTASAAEFWYTVKQGDNLWKIANEQLGSGGNGVAALKELNKDLLKGGDTVFVNMRLRLPGKPIAQAN